MPSALRWIRVYLIGAAVATLLGWSGPAHAYAWMVRHEYTGCATCHADPSGGGLLTAYGRAQAEILLRSYYGRRGDDWEPSKVGNFLLGAVPLPDQLLLGGDYRGAYFYEKIVNAPATSELLQMQADVEGQVTIGRFRANGSIGYDHDGAEGAWLTSRPEDNLVSRVFWAGVDLGEDKNWLVRAGRMNLPYGIRSVEHTLFIHTPPAIPGGGVQDDINDGQEEGVALAYNGEGFRGEVMVIAGNYQIAPDAYRERGYSGYLEWAPSTKVALGVSSLVTSAQNDIFVQTALIRQAHGVFARAVPWKPVVLLFEQDILINSQPSSSVPASQNAMEVGEANMLQADVEVWQGIHLMATGETTRPPTAGAAASYGGWATLNWFFAPHADIRIDAIEQSLSLGPTHSGATTLLLQLHAFL